MMIDLIQRYWAELSGLTIDMAPYLLFGFLFAGILRVFFPKRLLLKYMGKSNFRSALNASLLGVPMPLCSCGVLPTALSLNQNGASKGATTSFLISTPQTGVDSILVTYSMLGLPFAVIRPIVALLTGVAGGMITNLVGEKKGEAPEKSLTPDENNPRTIRFMLRYAFVEFLQDISKWLIIGLLIAAAIAVALPDNFFSVYITNDYLGMLVILIASIPLYVCATASVPIAAVLLLKGLSPGAILVFLMAGPATNSASFTVLYKTLGKRETWIYLFTIIGGALFFGLLTNLLPREWFAPLIQHHAHDHSGLIPEWLGVASAILLVLLIINGYFQKYFFSASFTKPSNKSESMQENILVKVSGMDCNHCKNSVESNLKKLDNIQEVIANLNTQTVMIAGDNIDLAKVKTTVEGLGYQFEGKVG
ncbi:MAG: permease [Bacteroidales bacterium]|nr:permease [Bacteroidales bacterium]